jgi:hypothetical protein
VASDLRVSPSGFYRYRDDILDFCHPAISNFQDVIPNEPNRLYYKIHELAGQGTLKTKKKLM